MIGIITGVKDFLSLQVLHSTCNQSPSFQVSSLGTYSRGLPHDMVINHQPVYIDSFHDFSQEFVFFSGTDAALVSGC